MENIWFELDYEELDGRELNRVLHASPEGLRAFISDLQRTDQVGLLGRYNNQIEGVSEDYYPPFDYIELSNNPPEEEVESTNSVDPFYLMAGGIVITVLLAIYAILRLITDFVI